MEYYEDLAAWRENQEKIYGEKFTERIVLQEKTEQVMNENP